MKKEQIIEEYHMQPHPEGGWYAELWQSTRMSQGRKLASQIYYLLEKEEISRWHRMTAEELWLFHWGAPMMLTLGGTGKIPKPQRDVVIGENCFHVLIPGDTWQQASAPTGDTLVSCIVSPGYDDRDWEMI